MKENNILTTNSLLIIIASIIVAFSCANPAKTIDIPDGIIPPDKMGLIFKDIHLTDALLTRKKLRVNRDIIEINNYYLAIYEKYGYDRASIDSSLKFYSFYPEVLEDIYGQILIELSKMEDTISAEN